MAELPLYFFLSYARLDDQDGNYLQRFFSDLRGEVRARCGHPSADGVGFLDSTNILPGDAWSDELAEALRRCRTFVAICSPTFFASEYCGREWRAFSDRCRPTDQASGVRYPSLLPVIWTPLSHQPPVLAGLQYDHSDFGKLYTQRGLRYLLQLKRNHDDYQEFLVALADRIVALAERSAPPELVDPPAFHALRSAFDPAGYAADLPGSAGSDSAEPSARPTAAASERTADTESDILPASGASRSAGPFGRPEGPKEPDVPEVPTAVPADTSWSSDPATISGGPKRVTFVLAATSAAELSTLRSQLDYYGSHYDEWMPYHPRFRQRVCIAAQAVAAQQDMSSRVVKLQDGISDLLERSRQHNEVVVFIVDAWASQIDHYHRALREYDDRNEPFTGVLVPWNSDDAETIANAAALKESLERALWKNVVRGDNFIRMEIPSQEEFDTSLLQLLVDTQARVFRTPYSVRTPNSPRRRRPFLSGP